MYFWYFCKPVIFIEKQGKRESGFAPNETSSKVSARWSRGSLPRETRERCLNRLVFRELVNLEMERETGFEPATLTLAR
jgi:hypothetical protein